MHHMATLFCQQDRKPSASSSAIENGVNTIKMFQQFPLNMIFLDNVVNVSCFPAAFKLSLVWEIPLPLGDLLAVIHILISPHKAFPIINSVGCS
jgi:hypothetical protein